MVASSKRRKAKESVPKPKQKIPEGKYLYGIILAPNRKKSFGNIALNGSKVYTINYKGLAAVVSDTELRNYPVTEEYSKAHDLVIRKALKKHSIVPAAFGQVFKNQKILKVLMKKAYRALKKSCEVADNKVELGVKAIILKGTNKKAVLQQGEKIYKALSGKAVEAVKSRLFSDRLILNASFLVGRNKIEKFTGEVGKLTKKYKNLKLKYSGPWAPYSFVRIKIGARGIELGKKR